MRGALRCVALAVLAVCGACSGTQRCYTPADQSAGWKRVELPTGSPALAAPADVDQFRAGEAAWLWLEERGSVQRGWTHHGRMLFQIAVPRTPQLDSRRLQVQFSRDLQGMKVDADDERGVPLLHEKRIQGRVVDIALGERPVSWVRLTVHVHLHDRPLIEAVRGGTLERIDGLPGVRLASGPYLFYRHPGGRNVALCDRPGAVLNTSVSALDGLDGVRDMALAAP